MIRISPARAALVLPLALSTALCLAATAATADTGGRESVQQQQIQALQRQLAEVQAQLKQLAEQNQSLVQRELALERQVAQQSLVAQQSTGAQPSTPGQPSVPAQSSMPVPAPAAPSAAAPAAFSNVRLWGYGEIYYPHPTRDPKKTQADLARAVFGIGYSFDSRTEFNSEFEVEHAVASSTDVDEFEVEQFYVDRQLSDAATVRAGLFLMPFGLLNEHHEPTNFYGVQRNFVETLIIPSTWREGGFNVHGDIALGINWD